MYKVAVITMGIRLDDEKGYTRFRSVNFSQMLVIRLI